MPSAAPRPDNATRIEPFRLRGANFNLLVLRLLDHRPAGDRRPIPPRAWLSALCADCAWPE